MRTVPQVVKLGQFMGKSKESILPEAVEKSKVTKLETCIKHFKLKVGVSH